MWAHRVAVYGCLALTAACNSLAGLSELEFSSATAGGMVAAGGNGETGGGGATAATGGSGGQQAGYPGQVLADNPLLYWRFGENPSAMAQDSSGNGNHGTYQGAVSFGAAGAIGGDTAIGFNRTDVHVTAGKFYSWGGRAPCSFEAWVKPRDVGSDLNIMSKMDDSNALGYYLFVDSASPRTIVFDRRDAAAGIASELSAEVQPAVYSHVVFTYDPGVGSRLFIDGVLRDQSSVTGAIAEPVNPFTVGLNQSNDCCWFDGEIDEVAVYDHALTAPRVLAHFDAAQ